MKHNSQFSDVLHVLLHLAEAQAPLTSEVLAQTMDTNPVVLRRLMAGLRDAGMVSSGKGHGGGWLIAPGWGETTLRDIHRALGAPALVSLGFREDHPECLVAQVVNSSLRSAMQQAEASLLAQLGGITLAQLSAQIGASLRAHRLAKTSTPHRIEDHHGHSH